MPWRIEKISTEEYMVRKETPSGDVHTYHVYVRRGEDNKILNITIDGYGIEVELPYMVLHIIAILSTEGIINLEELTQR